MAPKIPPFLAARGCAYFAVIGETEHHTQAEPDLRRTYIAARSPEQAIELFRKAYPELSAALRNITAQKE